MHDLDGRNKGRREDCRDAERPPIALIKGGLLRTLGGAGSEYHCSRGMPHSKRALAELTSVENTQDFSPGIAAILGEVSVDVFVMLIVVSSAS